MRKMIFLFRYVVDSFLNQGAPNEIPLPPDGKHQNIANEYLMYVDGGIDVFNKNKALDNSVYSSKIITPEDITTKLLDTAVSLAKNILWAFNLQSDTNLAKRIEDVLKANKF